VTSARLAKILGRARPKADGLLIDTCTLLAYTAAAGHYGHGRPVYTEGESLPCLFTPTPVEETAGQTQRIDGRMRFAAGAALDHRARLRLTHVRGVAQSPAPVFEIVAGPLPDHVGQIVHVQKVTE
jgi:hypothetical protein